jgi:hypothetical protein
MRRVGGGDFCGYQFLTFDENQKILARAEGLDVPI